MLMTPDFRRNPWSRFGFRGRRAGVGSLPERGSMGEPGWWGVVVARSGGFGDQSVHIPGYPERPVLKRRVPWALVLDSK